MYHDFLGREIEDLEGDNMRADWLEYIREWKATHQGQPALADQQPGPALVDDFDPSLGLDDL